MANINDYGFPFPSVEGDRQYGSAEWREYFGGLFSNGILQNQLNDLKVNPQVTPNKSIFVDTGVVFISGAMRILADTQTLDFDVNTSGNPRIDRIVARFDATNRKIEFAVLKGTPASSPVAKSLTRTSTVYELALADITLANGYSTITSAVIGDKRNNEELCGFAKTIYMQTFDDENSLLKYNRKVVEYDAYSSPKRIEYRRPETGTLFLLREYSSINSNHLYEVCTEKFYKPDGVTVYKTITYSFVYAGNGVVDEVTREVEI